MRPANFVERRLTSFIILFGTFRTYFVGALSYLVDAVINKMTRKRIKK